MLHNTIILKILRLGTRHFIRDALHDSVPLSNSLFQHFCYHSVVWFWCALQPVRFCRLEK